MRTVMVALGALTLGLVAGFFGASLFRPPVPAQAKPPATVSPATVPAPPPTTNLTSPWEAPPLKDVERSIRRRTNGPMVLLGESSIAVNNLGIEQFEQGRRTTHRRQLWSIHCGRKPREQCTIDRLVIDAWGDALGTMVAEHHHSTDDGTLRDLNIDWAKQRLDFTLVFTDGDTAQFQLQLEKRYLVDFRGYSASRGLFTGKLEAVEYRATPYNHTLVVPIQAVGLQKWGVKAWDEMIASFSDGDRRASERFIEHWTTSMESQKFPELKQEPKTEQGVRNAFAAMRDYIQQALSDSVEKAEFTPSAKAQVVAHFRELVDSFERIADEAVADLQKQQSQK